MFCFVKSSDSYEFFSRVLVFTGSAGGDGGCQVLSPLRTTATDQAIDRS